MEGGGTCLTEGCLGQALGEHPGGRWLWGEQGSALKGLTRQTLCSSQVQGGAGSWFPGRRSRKGYEQEGRDLNCDVDSSLARPLGAIMD